MDDEPVEIDGWSSETGYVLSERDRVIVLATRLLLRKMARIRSISSTELEVVAKLLGVLDRLPAISEEFGATIQLSGPRRWFGEHEIWHWWRVGVSGHEVEVCSGGHFYDAATGGDSFLSLQWHIAPDEESTYVDYLDLLQVVDDAQPFETEVARLSISESGYHFSVEMDDGRLDMDEVEPDDEVRGRFEVIDESAISSYQEAELILDAEADEWRGLQEQQYSVDNPRSCDLCARDLSACNYYADARLRGRIDWANMCSECFLRIGEGIGWGKGQLYNRRPDGKWLMVGGFRPDEHDNSA